MKIRKPNHYNNIKQKMKGKEQRQQNKEHIFNSKKTNKKN